MNGRPHFRRFLMLVVFEASPVSAFPTESQSPSDPPSSRSLLDVHGYVDTYYAHNFNRPADDANFIPGTGTTAKRSGEIALNLAALDIALAPKPVGLRLILNYGTGGDVVHSGEPIGESSGPDL